MRNLTADLDRRLKQVAVHLVEEKWAPFLEYLETLTALSHHELEDTNVGSRRREEAEHADAQSNRLLTSAATIARGPIERIRQRKRIADAMNYFLAADRPRAEAVAAAIEDHRSHLAAAGLDLRSELSRRQGAAGWAQRAGEALWLALGFVPALAGLLHHLVPFVLTRLAARLIRQPIRATIALSRLGPGLLIYAAWYALAWWWLSRWLPGWAAWTWMVLMPLAGIQALHYWPRAGQSARVPWQKIRIGRRPGELERLRAERATLSERLGAMAEDFAALGTESAHGR